jgi:hypothetical protein
VASGLALTAIGTATNGHTAPQAVAKPARITPANAAAALSKLPTAFEPARRGFLARGVGYDVFLDRRGAAVAFLHGTSRKATLLRSTLVGGRSVTPSSESRLPGVVNRYSGPHSQWREGIPTYARVRYRSVYPGIDAVYHGRAGQLEYDFNVAPEADPGQITMRLSGARSLSIAHNGDLLVRLPHGTVRQTQPVAYQRVAGQRVPVTARYRLTREGIGFALGAYDRSHPLVIDPVLSYASYFGGNNIDTVTSVAIGSDGSVFLAGGTRSATVPGYPGVRAFSSEDAFVTRIAADGSSVIYTAILGDAHAVSGWTDAFADDQVNDMLVSGTTAIVVGSAKSTGYPASSSAPEDYLGSCSTAGQNGFLTFLTAAGSIGYSSCVGGTSDDEPQAIATRFAGGLNKRTYYAIAGTTRSADLPGSSAIAGYQNSAGGGTYDGFLMQVASDNAGGCTGDPSPCTFIHYRTYIGGTSNDAAYGVGYDTTGYAVVTGDTASSNFPVSSGSGLGGTDAWTAKFGVSGTTNVRGYSLRYGGDGDDSAHDLALDSSNNAYIAGTTASSSLPATPVGGNLVRGGGDSDGFLATLDTSGSATNSVFVGGTNADSLDKLALQQNGSSVAEYAVGTTSSGPSATFTPRNTISGHPCTDGNTQAFVVKRIVGASPEGAIIACLGGNDADGDHGKAVAVPSTATDGTMWIGGQTGGGFAGVNGVQTTFGGSSQDGFLARLTQTRPSIDSGPSEGAIVSSNNVQFQLSTPDAGMHFACSTPVSNQLVAGTRAPANCPASTATYNGLGDGLHAFEAATVDDFGSESASASRTFTVDTTQPDPFDLTAPADGDALNTTQPTFSWSESHDTNGISYSLLVDNQPIQTVAAPSCSGGTCSARAVGPIFDGAHTVKVVANDGAAPANTRDSGTTRNFTVVDPVQARFTIAPNPALAGRTVQFDGSASADASHKITRYEWDLDGDGTFETDTGTTPTTGRIFFNAGTFTIALRVTGDVGGTTTSTQSLKVNDATGSGPQIGVSINVGAQYANKPDVMLTIVAPPGATSLLVSNDGGFAGALPTPLTKELAWKLDSSGPERLPKTVYLRFLTGPFASPNYTDDIILDERPPVVDAASVVTPPPAGASVAKLKTYKVKVKARDSNSGVGFVQVTANKRKPGKRIKYAKKLRVKAGSRPRFLRAQDRAGNYSAWKKLR